jgi:acyl-CoA thioester hydrolase
MGSVPRHVYLCPVRWADLDALGHVNNVTYTDYLQEARVDMLREHAAMRGGEDLAEAAVVVRHEVDFAAPLHFRPEPVRIEVWVTQTRAATFTLGYEILDLRDDGSRKVYVRARTVLSPYVIAEERPRRITDREHAVLQSLREAEPSLSACPDDEAEGARERYDLQVRFSDVDVYRHVNNVKYLEYYQEARIAMMARRHAWAPDQRPDGLVLARMEVDYRRPILLRPEPYQVESWVTRVGGSSFTVRAEILDGGAVLSRSRSVVVTVDPGTGRSRRISEDRRDRLLGDAAA